MSFLEKLASFFLIEQPDPDDPYETHSAQGSTADSPAVPPVHRLNPTDLEPKAEAAEAPRRPAKRVSSHNLQDTAPVPVLPAAAAEADQQTDAPAAEGAKPAPAPQTADAASEPEHQSAASSLKKKVSSAVLRKKTGAPTAELHAPTENDAVPAGRKLEEKIKAFFLPPAEEQDPETEPMQKPSSSDEGGADRSGRSLADKVKAFFFPADDDADDEIAMHDARDGRRPVGTKVRMAAHRFTTVKSKEEHSSSDCMPLDEEARSLLELARVVRRNAYAKYSGFQVGAALKAASGKVYFGVNVENASYPAGICAERSAFTAAVTAGERQFRMIAICGGDDSEPCFPCGICRQVLMELCPPDMPVVLESGIYRLDSLLPHAFQFTNR